MNQEILRTAFRLMCHARHMSTLYDNKRSVCRYVHSTSRGHEAIQIAAALQLEKTDWVSPYYRDDSMLLGLGFEPYELMLQLLAKAEDPFSGGREYYSHPSYRSDDKPKIIHQSSATGMQAIPSAGIAQGIQYLDKIKSPLLQKNENGQLPVVLCSMGDASMTEGEVSESIQFAILKQLPIVYLVQDNNWGISVSAKEARAMDAYEYAGGFPGIRRIRCDGSDFEDSFTTMQHAVEYVRKHRCPYIVVAEVPLLGHHTSGVRQEFYRSKEDLERHLAEDPLPKLKQLCISNGISQEELDAVYNEAEQYITDQFEMAMNAEEPDPSFVEKHVFAPTEIIKETDDRSPDGAEKILMVDAGMVAIREIMEANPEAVLYGQDVGYRLGGVFREAATLADQFGSHRVFNTAIQEAYIIGSTVGMSAVGVKPIVEIQFADYIYPGFNQLVTEISKSCYLSNGKFPVQSLIRVPIGAYGGGGPYHSGSVESTLLTIKGIKVVYPSNAADMKGLMKAAFYDPNPVVMLEHKGLYWSKVPGTEDAKTTEPSSDYCIPLGKANVVLQADDDWLEEGETCCIITYGMGVYWAKAAAKQYPGQVEIIDLRTLFPLDEALIFETVKKHGKCIVLTEEQQLNSFAEALAHRINYNCFQWLDTPVEVIGSLPLPAVPMNIALEAAMLPNAEKVKQRIGQLLNS